MGVEGIPFPDHAEPSPPCPDDTDAPLLFPAVGRKRVIADFDGGRLTSDGGVMLLAAAEHRLGTTDRLAGLIADPRNPLSVTHGVADILRTRMLAIACGYGDADDLDLSVHRPRLQARLRMPARQRPFASNPPFV